MTKNKAQVTDGTSGNDISSVLGLTTGKERKTKWSPEDVSSLIIYFLDKRKEINPDAIDILSRIDWGFGMRKILNFVDDLVAAAESQTITIDDLPFEVLMNGILNGVLGGDIQSYNEAKRRVIIEFDRIIITKHLTKYGGNAICTSA